MSNSRVSPFGASSFRACPFLYSGVRVALTLASQFLFACQRISQHGPMRAQTP